MATRNLPFGTGTTNLDYLDDQLDLAGLHDHRRRDAVHHLIGRLAATTDPATWAEAVDLAVRDAR